MIKKLKKINIGLINTQHITNNITEEEKVVKIENLTQDDK